MYQDPDSGDGPLTHCSPDERCKAESTAETRNRLEALWGEEAASRIAAESSRNFVALK
jgi:hypothetical protein